MITGRAVMIVFMLKDSDDHSHGGTSKKVMGLLQRRERYSTHHRISDFKGGRYRYLLWLYIIREERETRFFEGKGNQTFFEQTDGAKPQNMRWALLVVSHNRFDQRSAVFPVEG